MSSSTGGLWESEGESDSEEGEGGGESNSKGGDGGGDDEEDEGQSSVVSWHGEKPANSGLGSKTIAGSSGEFSW